MPLSRSASIVSADALPDPVKALLRSVGVPSLLTGLFEPEQTSQPLSRPTEAAAGIAASSASRAGGGRGAGAGAAPAVGGSPPRRQLSARAPSSLAAPVAVPVEFWCYVYQPNRSGILEALGALLRRHGATTVIERFEAEVDESQRDALRHLISVDAADELSSDDVDTATALPIYRAFERTKATKSDGDNVSAGAGEGGGGAAAAAAAGVLMSPTKFVVLKAKRLFVLEGYLHPLPTPPTPSTPGPGDGAPDVSSLDLDLNEVDTDTALMTPCFLGVPSRQEHELLARLGVASVRRSEFYTQHVLPRLGSLNPTIRDRAMCRMLLEVPQLTDKDRKFGSVLRQTAFVPVDDRHKRAPVTGSAAAMADAGGAGEGPAAGGGAGAGEDEAADGVAVLFDAASLRTPSSLFDPDEPELVSLLDVASFPAGPFKTKTALMVLRSLGLQSTLSWGGLIECAHTIEEAATRGDLTTAAARGHQMLSFMDVHHTRLFPQPKKPTGFLGSVASALFSDKEAAEREAAQLAMSIETLKAIQWCPVKPQPPPTELYLPWKQAQLSGPGRSGQGAVAVAAPLETRLASEAWSCSHR